MTSKVLSYRFRYGGKMRHLDNCRIAGDVIIGYEVRERGRFSQRVKSFRLDRIEGDIEQVTIDRRNRPELRVVE